MSRSLTPSLLASFIEYAVKDCVTPLEWNRFAVTHYHDEKMRAARRHCVRILMPRPVPKRDLDFLYSIAADLRAGDQDLDPPLLKRF
jgi:hypothetical protein